MLFYNYLHPTNGPLIWNMDYLNTHGYSSDLSFTKESLHHKYIYFLNSRYRI